MKYLVVYAILFSSVFFACNNRKEVSAFVSVDNGNFYCEGKPYAFLGANYWQGMNLGAAESGDRERLLRELDDLKLHGIDNLRIMASSEADEKSAYCIKPALQLEPGVYDDDLWGGLDFLLDEMAKRNMKAVMVLSNFWSWSGGFSQYLTWAGAGEIPYPQMDGYDWGQYVGYTKEFYKNKKAMKWYANFVKTIVSRTNTVNGIEYRNDPTIMSWQLANEPRGLDYHEAYQEWIKGTAKLIKRLDSNHLVSLGSEGDTPNSNQGSSTLIDNSYDEIDYVTMHIWAQNWGWFEPGQGDSVYSIAIDKFNAYWDKHVSTAEQLKKPIVLEEFGLARDGVSYDPSSSTTVRDKYYTFVFNKVLRSVHEGSMVKGVNFWAYSGEGRPPRPGKYWQEDDSFVGDPPHELQGWYSVYDTDESTMNLIKEFGGLIIN